MKRYIKLSLAVILVSSVAVQAADIEINGKKGGTIEVQLKAMSVISDIKNGYAPSNGSGYLVKLKYETPEIFTDGLKFGLGMYVNGDAGLTKWDEKKSPAQGGNWNKGAYGMVVGVDGKETALMGEAYLDYKYEIINAKIGRQILDTPLTGVQISLMPNFYEALVLDAKVFEGVKLTAGHITGMAFGSRAATDWGMIGERTGTAGVGTQLTNDPANQYKTTPLELVNQAEFYNMGVIAGKKDTAGRSLLALSYSGLENFEADFWVYHSYDIATDYYTELKYALPVTEQIKVKLNAQYLLQQDAGDALAGERDFNMLGAKVALESKKWGLYAAYNKSGDNNDKTTKSQYFNAWGADPAYTSSIFSRNAYRIDVDAFQVGGHYVILKGLKLMMSYSNYGESKTQQASEMAAVGAWAGNDAYEIDTVLVYKPTKEWMFKLFNAKRVSEYDTTTNASTDGAEQDQYRVVASYTF